MIDYPYFTNLFFFIQLKPMQITCYACGSDIEIDPPYYRCPACDTDLEAFVEASNVLAFEMQDPISRYYRQAADLTAKGAHEEALAVIQQGLVLSNASQFHVLAALIHRQRREYDQMRQHIAAIPIDDVLRPEGEWLLRSHQQQQRAAREAARGKPERTHRTSDSAAPYRRLRPEPASAAQPGSAVASTRWRSWSAILATLILGVVLFGWLGPTLYGKIAGASSRFTINALSWMQVRLESQTDTPTVDPESDAAPVARPLADPTETPTPTATATTVPVRPVALSDDARAEPTATRIPEPVAASSTASAVLALTNQQEFDFASYLRLMKRDDLAELEIAARRIDDTLVLAGVVSSTLQREEVLLLAQKLPGVAEINDIDLVVRLPEVYVVQPADTLWAIAYELYGDGTRWTELYQANQDRLREDLLLSPGQELIVPPLQ